MIIRKALFALAAASALALAARHASASSVTLTVDGCKDGQTIHTTVTFNCNLGVLCVDSKGKKTNALCGGIIFAACNNPGINTDTDTHHDNHDQAPPCDQGDHHAPDCTNLDSPDQGLPPITEDGPPCDNGHHDLPEIDCHKPCDPTIDTNFPTPNADTAATPLPSSVWGAGALMASLAIMHRLRRKLA